MSILLCVYVLYCFIIGCVLYYCICVLCLCIVYADNFSRVLLEQQPGIDGSDYINASYIDVSHFVGFNDMHLPLTYASSIATT